MEITAPMEASMNGRDDAYDSADKDETSNNIPDFIRICFVVGVIGCLG